MATSLELELELERVENVSESLRSEGVSLVIRLCLGFKEWEEEHRPEREAIEETKTSENETMITMGAKEMEMDFFI